MGEKNTEKKYGEKVRGGRMGKKLWEKIVRPLLIM
jgi:hypothetical protein